jgi:hypothetical protein
MVLTRDILFFFFFLNFTNPKYYANIFNIYRQKQHNEWKRENWQEPRSSNQSKEERQKANGALKKKFSTRCSPLPMNGNCSMPE